MNFTVLIYALLAGILPSLLWLWFWLREDELHPEPRIAIALAFFAGATSVILAIFLEKFADIFISNSATLYLAWASAEEIVKFGVVLLIVYRLGVIDEPIDAMIYCITVALGFAALENALFIFSPLAMGELSQSIVMGNLRFIGATLVHVVSSSVIGFMVALTFYHGMFSKIVGIIIGICAAIALHTSFNLAIIYGTAMSTTKVFGWVWIAVVILIILFEEVKAVRPKNQ